MYLGSNGWSGVAGLGAGGAHTIMVGDGDDGIGVYSSRISQHFSFSRHFAIFRKIWRERTRFLLHHSLPAGHSQQSEDDLTEIVFILAIYPSVPSTVLIGYHRHIMVL